MPDDILERFQYFLVPEKTHGEIVVQVVELSATDVVVREVSTGVTWTLSRVTFTDRVQSGGIYRVEPRWIPTTPRQPEWDDVEVSV